MLNPDGVPADPAHDARGVRGDRLRGGRHPRLPAAASTAENAFHRRALAIALLVGAPAAVLQPLSGDLSAQVGRGVAAGQARRDGGALRDRTRGRRFVIGGWPDMDAGAIRYAVPDPGRALAPGLPRSRRGGEGLDRFPGRDWPHVPVGPRAFQLMVALGTLPGAGRALGRVARLPPPGPCAEPPVASPRARARRADGLHRDRSRVDRHRGGPAAVDRLWDPAHGGRGDPDAGARSSRSSASPCCTVSLASSSSGCCIARSSAAHAHRMEPALRSGQSTSCLTRRWPTSSRVILTAGARRVRPVRRRRLRRRRVGPARVGPAEGAAARGHRARHRADLGGQPRLADPRRGADLHLLSRRPSPGSASSCTFRSRSCSWGSCCAGRPSCSGATTRRKTERSGAGAGSSPSRAF